MEVPVVPASLHLSKNDISVPRLVVLLFFYGSAYVSIARHMLPDLRTRVAHGIFCERNVFTRAPQLSQ